MRRLIPWSAAVCLVGLSACGRTFSTVDEACKDKVAGEKAITSPGAQEALLRIRCYRRLVKVDMPPVDDSMQEAVEAHTSYIAQNPGPEVLSVPGAFLEEPSNPGYYGATLHERLDRAEYAWTGGGWGQHEQGWYLSESGEAAIDAAMYWPDLRESILQPSAVHIAYSEAELDEEWLTVVGVGEAAPQYFGDLLVFYNFPATERGGKPILYPVDGQLDVPTFVTLYDPVALEFVNVGFPVSITVTTSDPSGVSGSHNPYNANLEQAKLVGPSGELELKLVHPGDGAEGMWPDGLDLESTVAAYALEPLEPNSDYTFSGLIRSEGLEKDVEVVFSTTSDPAPTDL